MDNPRLQRVPSLKISFAAYVLEQMSGRTSADCLSTLLNWYGWLHASLPNNFWVSTLALRKVSIPTRPAISAA
jgi:hypothetical protein